MVRVEPLGFWLPLAGPWDWLADLRQMLALRIWLATLLSSASMSLILPKTRRVLAERALFAAVRVLSRAKDASDGPHAPGQA